MKKILALAAILGAAPAVYAQDITYDARSLAMGGTGAAAANTLNASYQNPAALASLPNEKFALEIPIVSLRLLDADSLSSNLDSLNTSAKELKDALTRFNNDVDSNDLNGLQGPNGSAVAAAKALANFSNSLARVSNKSLMASIFGGTTLAAPSSSFSFALMLDGRAELGGLFNYASADQDVINTLADNLDACGRDPQTNATTYCDEAKNKISGGQVKNLASSFKVRGVVIKDVGVTAARHIDKWGDIDLGITPKFIQLTSYDFSISAQSGNAEMKLSDGEKKDSLFTIDLGASKSFRLNDGSDVKTGMVVKNVLPKTASTVRGNDINISPQITAGVAYVRSWFVGTADLDLIKNKAMIPGFSKESQYLRVGAEFDAWRWAQLRLGYRHDLAGNYDGLPSVGLGLFHVLDLSVAAIGKKEAAATLQFGIHF